MSDTAKATDRRAAGEQVVRGMLGDAFLRENLTSHADGTGPGADLSRLALEQCFGAIWTRPGLDRRSRSLLTIGILMAKGYPAELRNHVLAGLGNGLTGEEILEATIHAVPYLGLPAAGQAMEVVARTLDQR